MRARVLLFVSTFVCSYPATAWSSAASRTSCPGLCRAPPGYRVTASGANIELCPPNHSQAGASRACSRCPWPSTFCEQGGLKHEAECPCMPGYVREQGVCTACELGTYTSEARDMFQSLPCQACPEGATTLQTASVNASACAAGFESQWLNASLTCTACPDGEFKDAVGNARCAACGPHTRSSPPRANRTACLCEAGFEAGPFDSPDVLGGSCVPECGPGMHGRHGSCSPCPAGHFKPAGGPECSACPPPRVSAAGANTEEHGCSCPRGTMEVAREDMLVVERLGAFVDESAESLSALGALVLPANASRSLWRLSVSGAHRALTVTVGDRLVYECGRGACTGLATIDLQGTRGLVNATALGDAPRLTLLWRTRREVLLRDSPRPWWPAAQAEAWAAAGRLRPGAAVFRARDVFSSSVAACAPCPAGLRCAAHVKTIFGI